MKKIILLTAAVLFVCNNIKADDGFAKSVIIGFGPVGYHHVNITHSDDKFKYDYKSYWSANFGYEKQFGGTTVLTQLFYSQGKFDKYVLKGTTDYFDPTQKDDVFSAGLTILAGTTINKYSRLQFPIYIGPGVEYMKGGPFHNIVGHLAVQVRMKFYFTDNIGFYIGGSGRVGYGYKGGSKEKDRYSIVPITAYADAGLVFSF